MFESARCAGRLLRCERRDREDSPALATLEVGQARAARAARAAAPSARLSARPSPGSRRWPRRAAGPPWFQTRMSSPPKASMVVATARSRSCGRVTSPRTASAPIRSAWRSRRRAGARTSSRSRPRWRAPPRSRGRAPTRRRRRAQSVPSARGPRPRHVSCAGTHPRSSITWPVTQRPSSLQSQATRRAASSGSPQRPNGIRVGSMPSVQPVAVGPGLTALTRIPRSASSAASVAVATASAPLETAYATSLVIGPRCPPEVSSTTEPASPENCAANSFTSRSEARTLTCRCASICSAVSSSSEPSSLSAWLTTSVSRGAAAATTRAGRQRRRGPPRRRRRRLRRRARGSRRARRPPPGGARSQSRCPPGDRRR